MGWFGYGIYDGDDTQTRHYDFVKWAGIKAHEDEVYLWLKNRRTKIPKEYIEVLKNGMEKVIKKMPKGRYFNEDVAIEWQMLLALLLDNNIKPSKEIYIKGMQATCHLGGEHADDFESPNLRRASLTRFYKRAEKFGFSD